LLLEKTNGFWRRQIASGEDKLLLEKTNCFWRRQIASGEDPVPLVPLPFATTTLF